MMCVCVYGCVLTPNPADHVKRAGCSSTGIHHHHRCCFRKEDWCEWWFHFKPIWVLHRYGLLHFLLIRLRFHFNNFVIWWIVSCDPPSTWWRDSHLRNSKQVVSSYLLRNRVSAFRMMKARISIVLMNRGQLFYSMYLYLNSMWRRFISITVWNRHTMTPLPICIVCHHQSFGSVLSSENFCIVCTRYFTATYFYSFTSLLLF